MCVNQCVDTSRKIEGVKTSGSSLLLFVFIFIVLFTFLVPWQDDECVIYIDFKIIFLGSSWFLKRLAQKGRNN